jgi:hypothetical protein
MVCGYWSIPERRNKRANHHRPFCENMAADEAKFLKLQQSISHFCKYAQ